MSPFTNNRKNIIAKIKLLSAEMMIVIVFYLISLYLFSLMVKVIFYDADETFDNAVFHFFRQRESAAITSMMNFFTHLGGVIFLVIANLILIVWFLIVKKHKWYSIKIISIALSSTIIMLLLKSFFGRARPLDPLLKPVGGLSFPSGHAMMAFAFYGLLIYLAHKFVKRIWLRWLLIVLLFATIVMIGTSRIYLRVHYPTDVVAGFALGILWLVSCIFLLDRLEKRVQPVN